MQTVGLLQHDVDPEHPADVQEHGQARELPPLFDVLECGRRDVELLGGLFLGQIQCLTLLLDLSGDPTEISLHIPAQTGRDSV